MNALPSSADISHLSMVNLPDPLLKDLITALMWCVRPDYHENYPWHQLRDILAVGVVLVMKMEERLDDLDQGRVLMLDEAKYRVRLFLQDARVSSEALRERPSVFGQIVRYC